MVKITADIRVARDCCWRNIATKSLCRSPVHNATSLLGSLSLEKKLKFHVTAVTQEPHHGTEVMCMTGMIAQRRLCHMRAKSFSFSHWQQGQMSNGKGPGQKTL